MYFGPWHALVKVRDRFFINSFRQSLHISQAALNSRRLISIAKPSQSGSMQSGMLNGTYHIPL